MDDKPMDPEKSEPSQKIPTLQPVQLVVANAQAPLPSQYITVGILTAVLTVLSSLFGGALWHLFSRTQEHDKMLTAQTVALTELKGNVSQLDESTKLRFQRLEEKLDEAEKRSKERFDELRQLILQKK